MPIGTEEVEEHPREDFVIPFGMPDDRHSKPQPALAMLDRNLATVEIV